MTDKIKKGEEGEDLAAEFLEKNGFSILERNYRHRKSEIDLIVQKENWLIFVEVKARTSIAFGYPEEFVDSHKKRMIFQGALQYMTDKDWLGNVRYDIVSVYFSREGTEIRHIEDAFY